MENACTLNDSGTPCYYERPGGIAKLCSLLQRGSFVIHPGLRYIEVRKIEVPLSVLRDKVTSIASKIQECKTTHFTATETYKYWFSFDKVTMSV